MSALILAAALAAGAPADVPAGTACPDERPIRTQDAGPQERGRKLGELPPGHLYRTVLRQARGCAVVEVFLDGAWRLKAAGPASAAVRPARKP